MCVLIGIGGKGRSAPLARVSIGTVQKHIAAGRGWRKQKVSVRIGSALKRYRVNGQGRCQGLVKEPAPNHPNVIYYPYLDPSSAAIVPGYIDW